MLKFTRMVAFAAVFLIVDQAHAGKEIISSYVEAAPTIDGVADEAIWAKARPSISHDPVAKIDITIKSVHTKDSIYFQVMFPDKTEGRTHKTMVWAPEQERYRTDVDREDTFVFKWSMEPNSVDLSVAADNSYNADIWFWKANRTDPTGYADDKMHRYSAMPNPDSKTVLSKLGMRFYLTRPGDSGKAAYKTKVYDRYVGERQPKYSHNLPQGSRADIQAKGVWRDGWWTIEFARKLATGHPDDIQFDKDRRYEFGVSRYEIAGRRKNAKLAEPNYGAGDVGELLVLRFN